MQAAPPTPNPQELQAKLKQMLQPWEAALADPASAQEAVLHRLLLQYAQTSYGEAHSAGQIGNLEDYRRAFPIAKYEDFRPLIQEVMAGDIQKILWEEPLGLGNYSGHHSG